MLNKNRKQELLLEQTKLLNCIVKDMEYHEKPDFLPFTKDNYFFDIVSDPYELIEAFRLRYLAYGSEDTSYIDSELFPLDMEFDIYDKNSTHFFARNIKNNNLCGYLRLIHDTGVGLQLEKRIDISDYREKYNICELSRYISYPRGLTVFRVLLDNLKRFAGELGIEKILGEAPTRNKKAFSIMGGVPMEPYREWRLNDKKEWNSPIEEKIYGLVIHLD